MSHKHIQKKVNRFSLVDLLIDIFIIASPFVVPFSTETGQLSPYNIDALSELLHLAILFLGYFGVALYLSQMYCATALKTDQKLHYRVLFPSTALSVFTGLIVLTILLSAYNLLTVLTLPVFTSMLLIFEAIIFGFSLGLDFGMERHRSEDANYIPPERNAFSESLSNIPYILLTVLLVFPTEFLVSPSKMPVGAKIASVAASLLVAILAANWLDRLLFKRLRISAKMNIATVVVVSLLMVVGFVGIDVFEIAAEPTFIGNSDISRIGLLFFFGVVPIRIGSLIFSRANLVNRILGSFAIIAFILVQSGAIEAGHLF